MTPEGVTAPARNPSRDETLIKALVRAHRWRRRIESGQAKSITDLAEQEGVTVAYVCRLLPLTCLAPEILETILDGRQPKGLRLAELLGNGPLAWDKQRVDWAIVLGALHAQDGDLLRDNLLARCFIMRRGSRSARDRLARLMNCARQRSGAA
jgi:hypothetical protein